MITRIEVNGFKTLSNFSLDFKPGLNILIGPIGAGKTNLVSFFEFLAQLVESEASEATSRVGGAGAIFRRLGEDNYEDKIEVHVFGCFRTPNTRHSPRQSKATSQDNFSRAASRFTLLFPATRDAVLFSKQLLKVSSSNHFMSRETPDYWSKAWQLEISASISDDGSPRATVNKFDAQYFDIPTSKNTRDDIKQLESFISSMLSNNVSLVSPLPRVSYTLYLVGIDLSAGRVYNIVPSRIKVPEDSAKPPGIDRDGSGLAATLYALQRSKADAAVSHWLYYAAPRRPKQFSPKTLDHLRSLIRIVNSSIEDVSVSNDAFDNQLRVRFNIHSGDYQAPVPLALMSDGTLKWIALMTAALTTQSVFSIEEPENYLHPHMQGQLVVILRQILFRDDEYRMTLMTTHSETLLNQCRPQELIIIGLTNGCTTAIRPQNSEEVAEEIRQTGFGLGYFYVTNALHDV